jgi:hypothetical protein
MRMEGEKRRKKRGRRSLHLIYKRKEGRRRKKRKEGLKGGRDIFVHAHLFSLFVSATLKNLLCLQSRCIDMVDTQTFRFVATLLICRRDTFPLSFKIFLQSSNNFRGVWYFYFLGERIQAARLEEMEKMEKILNWCFIADEGLSHKFKIFSTSTQLLTPNPNNTIW